MEWDVHLDVDFAAWLEGLEIELQDEIIAHANLLKEHLRPEPGGHPAGGRQ